MLTSSHQISEPYSQPRQKYKTELLAKIDNSWRRTIRFPLYTNWPSKLEDFWQARKLFFSPFISSRFMGINIFPLKLPNVLKTNMIWYFANRSGNTGNQVGANIHDTSHLNIQTFECRVMSPFNISDKLSCFEKLLRKIT